MATTQKTLIDSVPKGLLIGGAWRAAWRLDPNLELYGPDGLHPSVRGSYVGGLVITAMLLDRSPVGMPARISLRTGALISIPAADASVLQEAAAEAIAKFGKR